MSQALRMLTNGKFPNKGEEARSDPRPKWESNIFTTSILRSPFVASGYKSQEASSMICYLEADANFSEWLQESNGDPSYAG